METLKGTLQMKNQRNVEKEFKRKLRRTFKERLKKTCKGTLKMNFTGHFKKEHLTKNNLFFERIPFMQRVYTFQELVNKYHEVPLLIAQLLKLLISDNPSPLIRYKIIGYYNMFIYELYNMLLKEKYLDIKKINYDEYLIRIHSIIEYTHNHYSEKISLEKLVFA